MNTFNRLRIWLAIKTPVISKYLLTEKEQEKLIMHEFRTLALLFGVNTKGLTDKQLKKRVESASLAMAQIGLSASEAESALRKPSFPYNLADELSIISPYRSFEIQKVIDFTTQYYGSEENSKIVKEKSLEIVEFAVCRAISLDEAMLYWIRLKAPHTNLLGGVIKP